MDDLDDSVMVETTEPEHPHLCADCGQVWMHCDESCPGPKFRSYISPSWTCPKCEDEA